MKLKEIAENHGLTPEGVDYALTQYQIVICEITHGMLSKLSYDAKYIIRTAQERWCDTCDLKEPVEPKLVGVNTWTCGECGALIGWEDFTQSGLELVNYKYCPVCGKAVKWGCG